MSSIKWNILISEEMNNIPKDTDLLLTLEHNITKERIVTLGKSILHKMSPSSPGFSVWVIYDFNLTLSSEAYRIVAWANNVLPYKDNCWDKLDDSEYVCSDCHTHWTTSDISKFEYCPTCGEYKKEVRGD